MDRSHTVRNVCMTFLLLVAVAWLVLAVPVGLMLGSALRLADRHHELQRKVITPSFVPRGLFGSTATNMRQEL
jgi:hypothetical protein